MKVLSSAPKRVFHVAIVVALLSSLLSLTTAPAQAVPPTPPTCAQGGACAIGDVGPGGGNVFYIASTTFTQVGATAGMCTTDCKYLEAAPTSGTNAWTDNSYVWSDNISDGIGTKGTAIGTGFNNTVAMVTQSATANRAGSVTRAYRGPNDFSDWHLASKDELNQMCRWERGQGVSDARCDGGTVNSGRGAAGFKDGGGSTNYYYWSSSEDSAGTDATWAQLFARQNPPIYPNPLLDRGQQGIAYKSQSAYVRPIRAFAPATKIAITRASVGTERRTAFTTQPQISIQYANSDTATVSSSVVTATVSTGGILVGATTATASSGVATFSGLGVDGTVGSTYTITYTAEGLTVATASVTLSGTTCDGTTYTCQVGDTGPGGGKIFYVAPGTFTQLGAKGFMCTTACKYLEAAPTTGTNAWTDEDPYEWSGNINTLIGTTGTAIGTGYKNTLAIITQSNTSGKAATASQAYRGPNSLSDWFLPSKDELNQLCRWERGNSVSDLPCFQGVNNSGPGATGFIENYYWSSSEFGATKAWSQPFAGDPYSDYSKSDQNRARPIRAFGTPPTTISIANVGITAPVTGATPISSLASNGQYTTAISWSGSPISFAAYETYTATIAITPADGYTLAGVINNFYSITGATSVTNSANSGSITAVFPPTGAPLVVYVAPTPVPYLKTLTTSKLNLKDGKLVCTPGTYNAGYTLSGVIQGSATALFTPSSYTYNLLVNGVAQASLSVSTASAAAIWSLSAVPAGSLASCSVTVSVNSVTNTDKSSDNASAVSSALSTQTTAIATVNADYSASQSANSKAYQKALVDNRALWRKEIEAIRANYFDTIARITASDGTKKMIADKSTALNVYITTQKQSAADYKASQPAALAAREAANKAALTTRDAAIAKANAAYGTFIESIGYGVLIP